MDTTSLRQQLSYFADDSRLFDVILEEARDCYPTGDVWTLKKAAVLVKHLEDAAEEAWVELIKRFNTTGFVFAELQELVQKQIVPAREVAGLLKGRFAFNTPRE